MVGIAMGDMAKREEARRQAGRPYAEAVYLACVDAYSPQGWFAVDSVAAHCKRMARDVYSACCSVYLVNGRTAAQYRMTATSTPEESIGGGRGPPRVEPWMAMKHETNAHPTHRRSP